MEGEGGRMRGVEGRVNFGWGLSDFKDNGESISWSDSAVLSIAEYRSRAVGREIDASEESIRNCC